MHAEPHAFNEELLLVTVEALLLHVETLERVDDVCLIELLVETAKEDAYLDRPIKASFFFN